MPRKSATANPFIINDFYDQLEELVKTHNFSAKQIWNCDESRFPIDPARCNVVSVKKQQAFKVTCGGRRENVTTLAVCNATGRALDPLIIFAGEKWQSTWKGKQGLPNTFYGLSGNGWMTTDISAEWLNKFCETVKECALLLIFDGHLTHISIPIFKNGIQ